MEKFYFTFGEHPEYPYQDGYITIEANSWYEARDIFAQRFGLTRAGYLPFAFQYTREEWYEIIDEWVATYGVESMKNMIGPCYDEF